jgi:hypothetical protein
MTFDLMNDDFAKDMLADAAPEPPPEPTAFYNEDGGLH